METVDWSYVLLALITALTDKYEAHSGFYTPS